MRHFLFYLIQNGLNLLPSRRQHATQPLIRFLLKFGKLSICTSMWKIVRGHSLFTYATKSKFLNLPSVNMQPYILVHNLPLSPSMRTQNNSLSKKKKKKKKKKRKLKYTSISSIANCKSYLKDLRLIRKD